jgi:hypothetical protein
MTNHITRRIVRLAGCFVVVAWLVSSAATADAGTVVSSFKSEGAFAHFDTYDDCSYMYVSVSRGGTASAPETYLYYDVYNYCTWEYSSGWGRIPNSSFTVSTKRSKLKIDPASSAEMYTYGAVGSIELTWTPDNSIRWKEDGRWESITPTQRVRSRGKSESSAASVVGRMFSLSVQTESARVGKNRGKYTEVIR